MKSGVLALAKKLSMLSADEFKLAVAFAKEFTGAGYWSPTKKKVKRAYKKRAPKAVEVAPGVKVVKGARKKRSSSDEVDHSPRSVEEQVR